MTKWNLSPGDIEARSFAIIDAEAPVHDWSIDAWTIVRRMIHTTADFEYAHSVRMHQRAISRGCQAIKAGCSVFTDTGMARSGISTHRLDPFGVKVECHIADPMVAESARQNGTTRAYAAVDAVKERLNDAIYVVGNAPTALWRLLDLIKAGDAQPALVVGLPVGFVNAAEAKDALVASEYPHITAVGRKGGSAVAASVINALADLCMRGENHA